MKARDLYNPMMKWLLRSPLHFFVSGMYMLVTFTGRKSGKVYSTPVEYFFDGETLMFLTASERVWWRNLRDGASITVRIKGQDRRGISQAVTGDPAAYGRAFAAYLKRYPGREKYFDIRFEPDGSYNAADLAAAADRTVVVSITMQ